ncbi:MAG TPA: response regulator transcription factor [Bacteroidales bacterium]|nr:response regulator transcription factor [Bacteroidales bacterium]HRZ50319.1 response regulator transcription factor [Bacteroidales bacterium]
MAERKIRVMLVDDHRIFREGVASLFGAESAIEICCMASNGTEALRQLQTHEPEVVLLDLTMPEMGGLPFLKELKKLNNPPRVLILSMHSEAAFISEAIASGAHGYVCKDETDGPELQEAILQVASGETWFGKSVQQLMQQQFLAGIQPKKHQISEKPGLEVLSKREIEILRMVMEGMSNQEIADLTFVSIRTVETHKNNIMTKLQIKNTVELVKYAIRNRFFEV